jgi:hypothetical protein
MSFAAAFDGSIWSALEATMEDVASEADRHSSGPHSLVELAAMDYPYARRHGRALLDPSTINVQSGEFRAAWSAPQVMRFGQDLSARLVNDADVANWLRDGTRYMVPRPIGDYLESYAEKELERRIEAELRRWARLEYVP